MTDVNLIDWVLRIAESLATDKSNDWSEELAELDQILGFD